MYARREPDGRMVFGGHGKLDSNGNIGGHEWLIRDVERIFPQLGGVNWRYRWGGHIAITGDRLPHFHEPRKGMIAGLGYNGRGVAMSHAMRCAPCAPPVPEARAASDATLRPQTSYVTSAWAHPPATATIAAPAEALVVGGLVSMHVYFRK